MKRALVFLVGGTLISFLFQFFVAGTGSAKVDFYYASAFGIGWALAYFVDRPDWALPKKMGFSFLGVILLVIIGLIFFDFEIAIPSIIRFSTVFVAYYLIASFRDSKSLRS